MTLKSKYLRMGPKWYYENKQIAKQEDEPIIEDLESVAELTTFTSMDKDEIAEALVMALQRIDKLEEKINGQTMGI
ncbi:hypothetical protein [Sinanaerobacter sp. ZZT-01]|uniref:hypothetical protein n=1 Tax=Sinanaerobacter sp. ZZT-01 TaxID=3111540 RepID=UPI002D795A33|nr:hypothetical protein [Sinanaerobacter sp. ZZT-01]WRR94077.1 hypothetical protein U5921_02865 [Sinanaerobacter sp. ZZT-01]